MSPKGPPSLVPRHPTAQRLIDAAVRAMDAEGEAGLRVDAIVADAGVTIPVLYHHFGNREGLVQAAHVARLRQSLDQAITELEIALKAVHDRQGFLATIDVILDRVFHPNQDRHIRANVLGATYGRPDLQAEVAELQRESWNRVAVLFAEPQRRGWIRSDLDLPVFVGWMFGLLLSRLLMDIQEGFLETSAWNGYTRLAIYTVMCGDAEFPPGLASS
ncbi:MAG TPA: TetR/AcrR family transcriptional regulator [Acidimicrobiales bacterium]